ncbi:MAG: GNAT family protein [Sphingomonas sp.]|jgi:RimJ/RimL family protein N-acetyltransferase
MSTVPVIATERLRLRPLVSADADALHDIYSDAEAMAWWSHGPHETFAQTQAKVAESLVADGWRGWAITLIGDDRAIGTLGAHEKRQGAVVEIGYSLARARWGAGLATEALTALLDYLFEIDRARRVYADTDPDNIRSNAVLRKLGFTLEAVLREEWETHIGVRDSNIWGLLSREWAARK